MVSVPAAYICVILIWSTTPLTIQWSGEGVGFLYGLTGRMVLAAMASLMLMGLFSVPLPWHREARKTYLAAGAGIFSAMFLTYWSSQYIPSGWIALMFGLAPIVTGVMAALWLAERLSVFQITGMSLAVCGLSLVTVAGQSLGPGAGYGIVGMLLAVSLHSASAVAVKHIGASLSAMAVTSGGLLIAMVGLIVIVLIAGEPVPSQIPRRALGSIIYLGLVGSVLGFTLYFYVLEKVSVTRVALLTLMTPVIALALGRYLNHEEVQPEVLAGTVVILSGLLIYIFGDRISRKMRGRVPVGQPD